MKWQTHQAIQTTILVLVMCGAFFVLGATVQYKQDHATVAELQDTIEQLSDIDQKQLIELQALKAPGNL